MRLRKLGYTCGVLAVVCSLTLGGLAQDAATSAGSVTTSNGSAVPGLINYSSILKDDSGKVITSITGVTFLLYSSETGGAPLWMETQNVTPDKGGHYTVTLGATTAQGLPADLFSNGEARWLAVQIGSEAEQSRTLLVAVPYAMKAVDAQTLGGLPASAFVLAGSQATASAETKTSGNAASANSSKKSTTPTNPDVTGVGTVDYIPMWDTTSDIIDSVIFQKSSEIGIGTTSPAATLDVAGKGDVRDTLTLFPKSTDNTLAVSGTTFAISSAGKVTFVSGQTFPGTGTITGITTASGSGLSGGGTSGTLSLKIPSAGVTNAMLADSKITLNANSAGGLTTPGVMTLGSTYTIGLKACTSKQILQYSGTAWACASAGTGTVTSVASGAGLTGGPITGSGTLSIATGGVTNAMLADSKVTVTAGTDLTGGGAVSLGGSTTLNVDTTKIPTLGSANAFSAAQTINGPSSAVSLTVDSSGGIGDPQAELIQNNTSDYARLRFTDSGSTNYWDVAGTVTTSGSGPQLNFWNGGAGLNVLQIFPTSVQTNANLYVNNTAGLAGGDGADVYAPDYGVYANSSTFDGALLYGQSGGAFGSLSEADADATYNAAAAGWEYGGTQENIGLYGYVASPIGFGSYSEGYEASTEGTICCAGSYTLGSWSDTSGNSSTVTGIAALATVDNGYANVSYSNSTSPTAWFENDETTNNNSIVLSTFGGNTGDQCWFDVSANLTCDGTISPSVPVAGGAKKVAMYGVSAAENWFEDAGGGQLAKGAAVVHLDPTFAETVNTGVEYRVFLTPNGDCKGLYVSQKSATSFEVHELGGGTSNISFDYRIMAKRLGFETARMEDRTASFGHGPIRHAAGARKPSPDEFRQAHMKKAEQLQKKAAARLSSVSAFKK